MAAHASTDPSKAQFAQKIMIEEFRRPVTQKEVVDAKTFLEGNFTLEQENPEERADEMCFMEYVSGAEKINEYVRKIKSVSHKEVLRVKKKYLSKPYAVVVVGPK